MNKNKILSLFFTFILIFSLAACSSNDSGPLPSPEISNKVEAVDVLEKDVVTNTEKEKNNLPTTQEISKSDLGITMTLNGEFVDAQIIDLSEEEVKSISELGIKGFSINKKFDNVSYVIANVLIVENETLNESSERSKFPYIFAGNKYSIVSTLPISNNENVIKAQTGVIQQLCTIFFDEELLSVSIIENTTN